MCGGINEPELTRDALSEAVFTRNRKLEELYQAVRGADIVDRAGSGVHPVAIDKFHTRFLRYNAFSSIMIWLSAGCKTKSCFMRTIFGLFCQNEPRKKDGVTPVCFWNVAEKWLLS